MPEVTRGEEVGFSKKNKRKKKPKLAGSSFNFVCEGIEVRLASSAP